MDVAVRSFVALLSAPVAVLIGLVAVMDADIARRADGAGLGLPMVVTSAKEDGQPGVVVPTVGSPISLVIRKYATGGAGVVEVDLPLIYNAESVSRQSARRSSLLAPYELP